jgi:hypothetical protein
MPNIEKLIELRDFIGRHRDNFSWTKYGMSSRESNEDLGLTKMSVLNAETAASCGTMGCICGWAASLYHCGSEQEIVRSLGLTKTEQDFLFYGQIPGTSIKLYSGAYYVHHEGQYFHVYMDPSWYGVDEAMSRLNHLIFGQDVSTYRYQYLRELKVFLSLIGETFYEEQIAEILANDEKANPS